MKSPISTSKLSFFLILAVIFLSKCACEDEDPQDPSGANFDPNAFDSKVTGVQEEETQIYQLAYDSNGKITRVADENDMEAKLEHEGNRLIGMEMPTGQTYGTTFGPGNERIGMSLSYGNIRTETTFELTNDPEVLDAWVDPNYDDYEYELAMRAERTTEIDMGNGNVKTETNSVMENFKYTEGLTGSFTFISYVGNQPFQTFDCSFICADKPNNLLGNDAICMLSQDILIDAFSSITYATMPFVVIEVVMVNQDTQDEITFTWNYEYDESGRIISKDLNSSQVGFPPFNFDFTYAD